MKNVRNATFVNSKRLEKWIIPGTSESSYVLTGYIKEMRAYKRIITIPVEFTDMTKVVLVDSTKYQITTFDVDYQDYINAYKDGINILTRWAIVGRREKRYIIFGQVNGQDIRGEIARQENNYIYLDTGEKFFVKWNEPYFIYKEQINILRKKSDLLFERNGGLDNFGGMKIKPRIIL